MEKTFTFVFVAILFMFIGTKTYSQNCNLVWKDGSKLTSNAYSWTNPHLYDPKFQKLKDDKKDESILAYNADVASGKIAPASTYPMTFTVKKAALPNGGDEYTLTTNISGKDYSSYMLCKGDTIYSYRNKGVVELPDGKGGSLGFTIQGAQKLPVNIKVGDKLPTFHDNSFIYPTTTETWTKYIQQEGDYLVTYNLKALETLSFSSHMIHYMFAEVTGEEEVTIGGNKYKAYIIESEKWNKGKMDVSIETAYRDVNEASKKGIEKMQEKSEKKMIKKGVTNELGYTVSYLKEWFVPTIGIVKTESYDNLGGIAGGSSITSIE